MRIFLSIICMFSFVSCTTHLYKSEAENSFGKKFENRSGAFSDNNSFCKDCFSLGEMQLKAKFQTI